LQHIEFPKTIYNINYRPNPEIKLNEKTISNDYPDKGFILKAKMKKFDNIYLFIRNCITASILTLVISKQWGMRYGSRPRMNHDFMAEKKGGDKQKFS